MVTIHYNGCKALLSYNDYNRVLPCPCGAVDWNITSVTICLYAVYMPHIALKLPPIYIYRAKQENALKRP